MAVPFCSIGGGWGLTNVCSRLRWTALADSRVRRYVEGRQRGRCEREGVSASEGDALKLLLQAASETLPSSIKSASSYRGSSDAQFGCSAYNTRETISR